MDQPLSLSTAYATWVYNENDNQWMVRDENDEILGSFPQHWKEKDCMIAIRLGRKYELISFNTGIDFGKQTMLNTCGPIIEELKLKNKYLEELNERLSTKLEQLIINGED